MPINPNRIGLDEAYMRMAFVWAQRSKASRRQVGALIIKDTQLISDGYNGMPAGSADEICEHMGQDIDGEQRMITRPEVLHAEANALLKIARYGGRGAAGATLYVTHSPCEVCAKLIMQAGISRVVYSVERIKDQGVAMLNVYGVAIEHHPLEN